MVSQVARYGTRNSASARSSCGTWSAQGKSPSSDEATQIRAISPAARSKTQAEIRMAKVIVHCRSSTASSSGSRMSFKIIVP